ncbi:hypothetical protein XELAEV_18031228mg [Xenopus laevis]|uniref:Uncharacterized protein n=1 Tax=Xenopus laevis TaxID=8355 RepID=A0A974HFI2_XENLA|nr:hypothetical protein XELAEV_18031228mg [Xenopus laevis]
MLPSHYCCEYTLPIQSGRHSPLPPHSCAPCSEWSVGVGAESAAAEVNKPLVDLMGVFGGDEGGRFQFILPQRHGQLAKNGNSLNPLRITGCPSLSWCPKGLQRGISERQIAAVTVAEHMLCQGRS